LPAICTLTAGKVNWPSCKYSSTWGS
jgi:hypothetical protein